MSADVHPAERSAEISSQRANVGPRRTVDDTTPHAARLDRLDVEAVDPHRTRRTIDLLALTGQLVKPLAVDLDRRDHRRHLHQIPGEAVGSSTHLIVGDPDMSWVAVISPAASRVVVSVPSTISPS